MYEFEMVLCRTSGSWQGDCSAGCEYDCWKDPERVESVASADWGHERPTETLPPAVGT